MSSVLVVEDNADLAFGLRNSLEIAGYDVAVAADGPSGVAQARELDPDVVVLDLMLPGMDGYRVLRTLREDGLVMPVLILTARGEEADKVLGFRLGADDYVTKPFGVLELLARIEALLRRGREPYRRHARCRAAAQARARSGTATPHPHGLEGGIQVSALTAGWPGTKRWPEWYDSPLAITTVSGDIGARTLTKASSNGVLALPSRWWMLGQASLFIARL